MKIEKFNEFKINKTIDISKVIDLIEKIEITNLSDPILISEGNDYKTVVSYGYDILEVLINRNRYIWNIAIKEITNVQPEGKTSAEINTFWKKWYERNNKTRN